LSVVEVKRACEAVPVNKPQIRTGTLSVVYVTGVFLNGDSMNLTGNIDGTGW
jgi:hypothetical protein